MTRLGPDATGIRLIASDLDGTILSHRFEMSERTVAAFGAARAAGYEVVFVTGRPPWFFGPLRTYMGSAGHTIGRVIGANGAVVYDLEAERILASELLPAADALETVEGIRQLVPHAAFGVDTLAGPVAEPAFTASSPVKFEHVEDMAEMLRTRGEEIGGGVLKLYARDPQSTDADAFLERAQAGVSPAAYATHSVAGVALFEVSRAGVTKAHTLEEFAHALGIAPEEVLAFGDMPNDLEMLAWAGHGYAMASGHPRVLEQAERIAPPFEEDGVAQVIEALLETGRLPEGQR